MSGDAWWGARSWVHPCGEITVWGIEAEDVGEEGGGIGGVRE